MVGVADSASTVGTRRERSCLSAYSLSGSSGDRGRPVYPMRTENLADPKRVYETAGELPMAF